MATRAGPTAIGDWSGGPGGFGSPLAQSVRRTADLVEPDTGQVTA